MQVITRWVQSFLKTIRLWPFFSRKLSLAQKNYTITLAQLKNKVNVDDISSDFVNLVTLISGLKSNTGSNMKGSYPNLWTTIDKLSTLTTVDNFCSWEESVKTLQDQLVVLNDHQQITNQR